MFLPVKMCGVPVNLLVDTGATKTIISKEVFDKLCKVNELELKQPAEKIIIEMADKHVMQIEGIVNLSFTAGYKQFQWDIIVANTGDEG